MEVTILCRNCLDDEELDFLKAGRMHCFCSFSYGGLDPSSVPLCAAVLPRTGGVADVLERANVLASPPKRPEKLAAS
eukprot:1813902-Pyramimonas_sp.AAC.1